VAGQGQVVNRWIGNERLVSKTVRKGRRGDVRGQSGGWRLSGSLSSLDGARFPAGMAKVG